MINSEWIQLLLQLLKVDSENNWKKNLNNNSILIITLYDIISVWNISRFIVIVIREKILVKYSILNNVLLKNCSLWCNMN